MDIFWFLVVSFFVFYLPFKLWLTKEEKNDSEKIADAYKYKYTISDGASNILAKENFDLKVENNILKNRLDLLSDMVYNLEEELENCTCRED